MKVITDKQRKIFDFILACVNDENYIPTAREIADQFGLKSASTVRDHLNALEKKGYIHRRANSARGIEIMPEYMPDKEPGIPVIGRVAAGRPITAIENLDGYLRLNNLYDTTCHYALRVHGDSMIDDGIWDGDFAIVREQSTVENGQIAVAIIEGEATVKRIQRLGRRVDLIPANDLYDPIHVDLDTTDFRIGGKVVGVHRVLN